MPSTRTTPSGRPFLPGDSLAQHFGKPRSDWTADDLADLFRERGLRIVSLLHVGGDGWLKTLDFVPRYGSGSSLPSPSCCALASAAPSSTRSPKIRRWC